MLENLVKNELSQITDLIVDYYQISESDRYLQSRDLNLSWTLSLILKLVLEGRLHYYYHRLIESITTIKSGLIYFFKMICELVS